METSPPPLASSGSLCGIALVKAGVNVDSHPRMPVPAGSIVGRGSSTTSSTMNPAWNMTMTITHVDKSENGD